MTAVLGRRQWQSTGSKGRQIRVIASYVSLGGKVTVRVQTARVFRWIPAYKRGVGGVLGLTWFMI